MSEFSTSKSDDNNEVDIPPTPSCLQHRRICTRQAPDDDHADDSAPNELSPSQRKEEVQALSPDFVTHGTDHLPSPPPSQTPTSLALSNSIAPPLLPCSPLYTESSPSARVAGASVRSISADSEGEGKVCPGSGFPIVATLDTSSTTERLPGWNILGSSSQSMGAPAEGSTEDLPVAYSGGGPTAVEMINKREVSEGAAGRCPSHQETVPSSPLHVEEEVTATSSQRSQSLNKTATPEDEGMVCLGKKKTAAQSCDGGEITDSATVIPAGFKRSNSRPRQYVRRRVQKPHILARGTRMVEDARSHPQLADLRPHDYANHEMAALGMFLRDNNNPTTASTRSTGTTKLDMATASTTAAAPREALAQKATLAADCYTPKLKGQISAKICELERQSVLNAEQAEQAAWRSNPQDNAEEGHHSGSWKSDVASLAEVEPLSMARAISKMRGCEGNLDPYEQRSGSVKTGDIEEEEETFPGEVLYTHADEPSRTGTSHAEKKESGALLRERSNSMSTATTAHCADPTVLRWDATNRNLLFSVDNRCESHQITCQTAHDTVDSGQGSKEKVPPPPLLPDDDTTGDQEIAYLSNPQSLQNSDSGMASSSPPRHRDKSRRHRNTGRISFLIPQVGVSREESEEDDVEYRSLDFVARQEVEQLAAERRREELVRADEEARRLLASASWVSRASRAILARSSSTPPSGVGSDGEDHNQGSLVFEHLTRHNSDDHINSGTEYDTGAWGTRTVGGDCGFHDRHPFTPLINSRSNLIASTMLHRGDDGSGSLQERLHRDGEEHLRRQERRTQLADQAIREKATSFHINPWSERVLARRFKSRATRFKNKMIDLLKVVDANRTGWLSFTDLERVLSECGMLPGQAPPELYDDVLLNVWKALSEERPSRSALGKGDDGCGVQLGQAELEEVCSVPVDRLLALLTSAVSGGLNLEWENSIAGDNQSCFLPSESRSNTTASKSPPANSGGWKSCDNERRGTKSRGLDAPEASPWKKQTSALCQELNDIYESNRRYRARRTQVESNKLTSSGSCTIGGHNASTTTECQQSRKSSLKNEDTGTRSMATPSQMAATFARFEEQVRARARKIELLRKAEEDREKATHPFKPTMATSADTPGAQVSQRKAVPGGEEGTPTPSVGCGNPPTRRDVVVRDQHAIRIDRRTSEQREIDEKCTFQPRLYQPLSSSPLRHPHLKNTRSNAAGEPERPPTGSSEGASKTVDRAAASWNKQVDRLKAGRKKRLRHLEEKRAIENRSGPLPPSVQQLFVNAGIQIRPEENISGREKDKPKCITATRASDQEPEGKITSGKRRESTQNLPSDRFSSSSLRWKERSYARSRLKDKKIEEQVRKKYRDSARRLKQKRIHARASMRSAAVGRLEAALSAREAEWDRSGWGNPPVLIAEVEFLRQNRWALLPLWPDTCPREAVGELARQQQVCFLSTMACELEVVFRVEIERACKQTTDQGLGCEKGMESSSSNREIAGQGGSNRRTVPTVVLRVEVDDVPDTKNGGAA